MNDIYFIFPNQIFKKIDKFVKTDGDIYLIEHP